MQCTPPVSTKFLSDCPVMLDTNPAMKALRSEAWRGLSRAPARGAATERVVPR